MKFPQFGPFSSALEAGSGSSPVYLKLLSLQRGSETQSAIDQVTQMASEGLPQQWIDALLWDPNWRPNLVGAFGLLLSSSQDALPCTSLWRAIDVGSWVTPQLIIVALFCDPDFPKNVAMRLNKVVAGEPVSKRNPAKVVASLIAVTVEPPLQTTTSRCQASPQVQQLLNEDAVWDQSINIAQSWRQRLAACFRARGIVLRPKYEDSLT